jgi:5-(carboxyamino)imidazole ribonucleotide mutase
MPPGIPVATMAVDGAKNAGLFAAKILAINNTSIANSLQKYTRQLEEVVLEKATQLEREGYQKYLSKK